MAGKTLKMLPVVALLALAQGAGAVPNPASPEALVAGFEQRVEAMFRAESGKPLVRAKKQKPLGPGRGNYVRAYSYSMVGFAARCLYLNEMLDEANAALAENARHYLDHPADINDRDSFHWHAEIVLRLIDMYGSSGSRHAGRITPETETLALRPIWEYARKVSRIDKAEIGKSQTWDIYLSENHHAMSFTLCWHFSKIARERPEYRNLKYDDQATAAAHHRAWSAYFVAYCRERARKSPCIEMMCDGYNSTLIKGFYNFHDFGGPELRRSAGMLLDLYFAYWAQEQINGVQGGGRSRIYFFKGLQQNREHGAAPLAWLYFGIGKQPAVNGHDMNAALSDYRPPAVVADIATDVAGRGRYEVRQRPQGLGATGRPLKTAVTKVPTRMATDGGGILRYSYCDPAFIMGTPMTEARPLSDWAAISAQNRWQGVIFAGEDEARIVPIVRPKDNRVAMNAQWSVQSKGTLITQKLKHHKGGAEMIVWISKEGLGAPEEEDGIVFLETSGAYAAIRVPTGGFRWFDGTFTGKSPDDRKFQSPPGRTMILKDEYAPVILEVMAKSDVQGCEAFKATVKACAIRMDGPVLNYKGIYGDHLAFDTSYRKPPSINGTPVDYAPGKVFESPFLNADYDRGIVTISKGTRTKVLDFTEGAAKPAAAASPDAQAFQKAAAIPWRDVFSEPSTGDWNTQWFLDGEIGTVTTGPDGMTLTAGPEFKNDAHPMVLWTRESFAGDLKIEYDDVPDGLFATGVTHHVTVIKTDRDLFMRIGNPEQACHCHMTNPKLPVVTEGRVGLRHMFTRSARYRNFRISTPARDGQ